MSFVVNYPNAFGEKKDFYMSGYLGPNLDNFVKGVINKNTSAVWIIDGRSGLGKTTLSFQIGCYTTLKVREMLKKKKVPEHELPTFTLDNVCWTPEKFIERLKNAKMGEVIILDESMILSNRSVMSEMNKATIIMMSMIRSKQLFIIFNANSLFDLDKNLPLHRADMLLHVYAIDDKFASRGRYYCVPSARGRLKYLYISGKKFYDYSKAMPAFRDRFTAWFPFDEKEYEKRKQEGIEKYFQKGLGLRVKNQIRQRDLAMVLAFKSGNSVKKISEEIDLGYTQAKIIIQRYKEQKLDEKITEHPKFS